MSGAPLIAFALAALMPVMIGPLPAEPASLTAKLCNGGTITIPVDRGPPKPERDCHPKGCHAGTCRPNETRRPNRAN